MSTEHTPGPWEVQDKAILCENVNEYGNFWVAGFGRDDMDNTPEDYANANLIAASPALLEACRDAELRLVQCGIAKDIGNLPLRNRLAFVEGEMRRVVDILRAAIAAATTF